MRDVFWDVVKGCGVILVVLGHTGMFFTPYLYMYHVALFFFLAGFFFKENYAAEPINYLASRVERLLYPTVKYVLIILAGHNLFVTLGFYTSVPLAAQWTEFPQPLLKALSLPEYLAAGLRSVTLLAIDPLAGALWFIMPMFLDLVILCLAVNLIKRKSGSFPYTLELWLMLLALSAYSCGVVLLQHGARLEWNMELSLILLPIVIIGWFYRRYQARLSCHELWLFWGIIPFAVFRYWGTGVELSQHRLISPLLFFVVTLTGIMFHLGLCRLFCRNTLLQQVLAAIGRHSLFIIAFHFLAFKLVNWGLICWYGFPMEALAAFPCLGYPLIKGSWWSLFAVFGVFGPLILKLGFKHRGRLLCMLRKKE